MYVEQRAIEENFWAGRINQQRRQTWFSSWFDSPFYHQLYGYRDEREAAGFIDALLDKIQPPQGSRMMDLGCGTGRHAKYLASRGFNVTGIDLSLTSIQTAQQAESSGLQFSQHDMRLPFGIGKFDYVFNFFTSFGYFKTQEEDHQVIGNISLALKPGGILVIDYLNVPYSLQHFLPEEEKEIEGINYRITRWTDEKYIYKQIEINIQSQGSILFCEQVARLSSKDFERLFQQNGLSLLDVYGDYSLGEYKGKDSPRLILIARKDSGSNGAA